MRPFRLMSCAAAVVVALSGYAAAAEPLSPEQEEAVRQLVIDVLKNRPEIIIEALQAYEIKRQAEQKAQEKDAIASLRSELEEDPASPFVGNPEGDVTIVEFSDYRCGYCKKVFPSLQALLKEDPKLRLVIKEFPVLGEESVLAARAGLAIWQLAPGKYDDFHAVMMANRGALTEDKLLRVGEGLGVSRDRMKAAMASPEVERSIGKNHQLAGRIGIQGTPAFIVGGQLVPGAVEVDVLRQLVAHARQR